MTSDWTVSHCSLRCSQSSLNKLDKLKLSCQDLKKYKKKKERRKKFSTLHFFNCFLYTPLQFMRLKSMLVKVCLIVKNEQRAQRGLK